MVVLDVGYQRGLGLDRMELELGFYIRLRVTLVLGFVYKS